MVKINLLPWREERRQQLTKEFYILLGIGGTVAAAIVASIFWMYSQNINFQKARNAKIQAEIVRLDGEIKEIEDLEKTRDDLLARKKVIEELQANRTQMVHLFDEMVKTIPNGVFLQNIKQSGTTISLEGYAQSHSRVSAYMREIEKSEWFQAPVSVEYIKADDSYDTHEQKFKLMARLINPLTKTNETEGEEE
ncbi:MAG: PilN domain-containing protein [Alcanivoracaceae bacterium]|nr:PilN domain-containing protein [Alcanivoracaceae bacterium]